MSASHLIYVDHAKSIGILLMVVGHVWSVNPAIRQFISSFHMPLFFFIAGFLYRHVAFGDRAAKDWRSLLLPYLLINACCMAVRLIIPLLTEPGYAFWRHFMAQCGAILIGESLPQYGLEPVCGPSWFILAIALLHLMAYIKVPGYFLSLMTIAATWLMHRFQIGLPGPVDSAVMAWPFFYLGAVLRRAITQKIDSFRPLRSPLWSALLLALTAGLTFWMNRHNGVVDINSLNYGKNLVVYYLCSLSGTMMIFFLCLLIERLSFRRLDHFAGVMAAGTIVVVGFHRFCIAVSELALPTMTSVQGLVVGVVIFLIFYPVALICERHVPVLTGYRKTG